MSGRKVHVAVAALVAALWGATAVSAAEVNVIRGSASSPCAGEPCEVMRSGVRVVYGARYAPPAYVPVPWPEPYYLVDFGPTYEPAIAAYPDVIYAYPYLPPFGYYSYQPYNPYGRYGYRPMGYPGYRPMGSYEGARGMRSGPRRAPMEKRSGVAPRPRPKP